VVKKDGLIKRQIYFKSGGSTQKVQTYKCENGHVFKVKTGGKFSNSFIEHVVYVYLRCLSLNVAVDIVRETYEDDVVSKSQILEFVEHVADVLPTLDDIDRIYTPHRSGYLAFDGVWFSYGSGQVVLLVCFDPVSFDVISAIWNDDENQEGYNRLIGQVLNKLPKDRIKAIYGDGDNGLMLSLKHYLPRVPFQLCSVHKYLKMTQVVPVARAGRSRQMSDQAKAEIKEFAGLFRGTLVAMSKEEAVKALGGLLLWVQEHQSERFIKAANRLKHNFHLTLTHFDYPGMMRDNNLIECFNGCLKPRLTLMKGFKKEDNLDRYLKLFLLDFRFHNLKESRFAARRDRSPIELGGVPLPKYFNFLSLLRDQLHLDYQLKSP
jgi:hypothetical protein